MSLEEFAKQVEERVCVPGSDNEVIRRFIQSRWYRIESAYEDASASDKKTSFENEIITVSYAMSLDYRFLFA